MNLLSVRDRLQTAMHRSAGHAFRHIVGSLWAWPLNERALRQSTGPEGRPLASLPQEQDARATRVHPPAHQWTSAVSSRGWHPASRTRLSLPFVKEAIVWTSRSRARNCRRRLSCIDPSVDWIQRSAARWRRPGPASDLQSADQLRPPEPAFIPLLRLWQRLQVVCERRGVQLGCDALLASRNPSINAEAS
jgi:hypothetical protein